MRRHGNRSVIAPGAAKAQRKCQMLPNPTFRENADFTDTRTEKNLHICYKPDTDDNAMSVPCA
jgi:hypothetical protein